jgi:hypothetical protein
MKIYLRKNLSKLEPADNEAAEVLKKWKQGEVLSCEVKKPRNYRFHKKAFSLFNIVFENQDKYDTLNDVLTEIKLRTGHYQEHVTMKGVVVYVPKSISFVSMDEDEFNAFYNKAVNIVLKYFIPDTTREELEMEIALNF